MNALTVDGLDAAINGLDALLQKLSPAERVVLSKKIAAKIRRANKNRIAVNIQPDGSGMTPRKSPAARPLGRGAQIRPGQAFLYKGKLVKMRTIKTAFRAANPSRPTTKPYDDAYVWGYDAEWGGVKKYRKDALGRPGGGVRAKMMFRKIHQYRFLKQKAAEAGAAVGFMGGIAGRIAAEHQEGGGSLPSRQLLGFSAEDIKNIENEVVAHLAAAGV